MSKFIEVHSKNGYHILVNTEDIGTVSEYPDGGVLIEFKNSSSDVESSIECAESYDEVKAMLIAEVEL